MGYKWLCGVEERGGKGGKDWLCWVRLVQEKRGGVRGANRKAICLTVSRAEIVRWEEVEGGRRWSGKGVGGGWWMITRRGYVLMSSSERVGCITMEEGESL